MLMAYQIKVGLCLVAFYLVFKLLLSRETLHRFNRVLLLVLVVIALTLPGVSLPVAQQTADAVDMVVLDDILVTPATNASSPVADWSLLSALYFAGAIIVAGWFSWADATARRKMNQQVTLISCGRIKIHLMPDDVAPYSYFNHIVISMADYNDAAQAAAILSHERAHIHSGHSYDVLLTNLLIVFQWWNPAAWLLKGELQQIHEFEADEAVLKEGVDTRQYQLLLIRKTVGNQLFSMANNLNHNSLKRRIRMMTKQKTPRWQLLKALAVVPVAAVLAVACAQKSEKAGEAENPLVVSVEVPNDAPEVAVVGMEQEAEKVFDVVEQMPRFPGGEAELMQFLAKNMKYPNEAEKAKQEGRVIATFIVEENGQVTNAQVVKGVAPLLDAEALRVIGLMPRWEPGYQDGKAVRVKYTLPVTFQLK